jgi:hypothetical protein
MKRLVILVAALLLMPASAFARLPDQRPGHATIPVQARGTNVAAVDQQSPRAPARVHAPVVVSDPGFDWGPAAIGAATSAAVLIALLGAGAVRRRHRLVVS